MRFTVIFLLLHLPVMEISCFRLLHKSQHIFSILASPAAHHSCTPWEERRTSSPTAVHPQKLPHTVGGTNTAVTWCLAYCLPQSLSPSLFAYHCTCYRSIIKGINWFFFRNFEEGGISQAVGMLYHKPFCRNDSTVLNLFISMSIHVLSCCQGFLPATSNNFIKIA